MNRRVFVTILGAALAAPSRAEPGRTWRIAWLAEGRDPGRDAEERGGARFFFDALRELGYVEGRNLAIDYRFAEERADRLSEFAAASVRDKVDLIAVPGTREALAAKRATSSIPIVTVYVGDPVGAGLVPSLGAPGGNLTGTSVMFSDVGGKRLELLRQIVPGMRRVAVIYNPTNASTAADLRASEAAVTVLGLNIKAVPLHSRDRLDEAFHHLLMDRPGGVLILQDALIVAVRRQIADFALQNRLPSATPARMYAETGSLLSYGPDLRATAKRAATYVDRILKGAKPADLPMEQPTKFELVINLKTARALDLSIPPALLLRADQVIE